MLKPLSLALAAGIIWGVSVFATTWISIATGYAPMLISLLSDIYPGFAPTPLGSIVGLVLGFLDAFIGFYLIAWLYNYFNKSHNSLEGYRPLNREGSEEAKGP